MRMAEYDNKLDKISVLMNEWCEIINKKISGGFFLISGLLALILWRVW